MAVVSAIVVSYQTGPRLRECLYALWADPAVDEIIIVDNGNPPDKRRWIVNFAGRCDKAELVQPGENLGFGQGVNFGAQLARGDQFLVINPDAVMRQGSVAAMQAAAAGRASPWIVGGRIFDTAGREERGCRRRELTLARALLSAFGWNTWTLENTPPPSGPVPMPVISGAFFLTSAESFWTLEGFDDDYFLHVEDIDLCRRCRAAGGEVIYTPLAGALHYGATSRVSSQTVARHKANGLKTYFLRWAGSPIERGLVRLLVPLMQGLARLRAG